MFSEPYVSNQSTYAHLNLICQVEPEVTFNLEKLLETGLQKNTFWQGKLEIVRALLLPSDSYSGAY